MNTSISVCVCVCVCVCEREREKTIRCYCRLIGGSSKRNLDSVTVVSPS